MNITQIIGAIMLATGKPIVEVAKDHGYSKHNFYRVINGEYKSSKVRAIISELIGRPIADIWPDGQKNTPAPADRQKTGCR